MKHYILGVLMGFGVALLFEAYPEWECKQRAESAGRSSEASICETHIVEDWEEFLRFGQK